MNIYFISNRELRIEESSKSEIIVGVNSWLLIKK